MKLLIAIMSHEAARKEGSHIAIRETWLSHSQGVPHIFFMGEGSEPHDSDEMSFPVPDDYKHVTEKSLALFEHALKLDYEFVLHCGRDTYINIGRLLQGGFQAYPYAGHRTAGGDMAHDVSLESDKCGRFEYTSGGAGTWLSKKSMEVILASDFRHPADDLMYGTCLGRAGIRLRHDPRFMKNAEYLWPGAITTHLSRGTGVYDPKWMKLAHMNSL